MQFFAWSKKLSHRGLALFPPIQPIILGLTILVGAVKTAPTQNIKKPTYRRFFYIYLSRGFNNYSSKKLLN